MENRLVDVYEENFGEDEAQDEKEGAKESTEIGDGDKENEEVTGMIMSITGVAERTRGNRRWDDGEMRAEDTLKQYGGCEISCERGMFPAEGNKVGRENGDDPRNGFRFNHSGPR